MIATVVFWPRLVHGGWSLTQDEIARVVSEAAETRMPRAEASAHLMSSIQAREISIRSFLATRS